MNLFKNKKLITHLFLLFFFLILTACNHKHQSPTASSIISITSKKISTTLFYTGTVQPLKTIVVPSPAEGVIIDMPRQYGEEIKAGELLFVMSSTKFLTDYKAALLQFLRMIITL